MNSKLPQSALFILWCLSPDVLAAVSPVPLLSAKVDGGLVFTSLDSSRAGAHGIQIWVKPDSAEPELVYTSHGAFEDDNALSAAFLSDHELAVIMGTPREGDIYWRFERTPDRKNWQMVAKADVDIVGMAERFDFTSAREFVAVIGRGEHDHHFQVTDESRAGDPLYKRVLRDGEEYFGATFFPGEIRPSKPKPASNDPPGVIQPYPELPVPPLPELPRSPWRTVQAVLPVEPAVNSDWWAVIAAAALVFWGCWRAWIRRGTSGNAKLHRDG